MEFTKQFMIENSGCYSVDKLEKCSFMSKDIITVDDIINSEIPIKDKYWFMCRKVFTKEQNQLMAISCAETVLFIFEEKYPKDNRPRLAIEAAKNYLNGKISLDELKEKRAAAAVDAAAAYAADAYAAYAADAYAAAAAAAYAADAYAAAAAAAAYAAAAAAAYAVDAAAAYAADAYAAAAAADAYAVDAAAAYAADAYAAAAAALKTKKSLLKNLSNFCKQNLI